MKRFLGCSLMTLLVGGAFLAAIGWAVLSYHVLVREEIKVEAAWTRIENVYQRRSGLAELLVERSRRSAGPVAKSAEELSATCERASRLVLSPEVLNEPERFREILRVHGEQRLRMDETMSELRSVDAPMASAGLDELESRIRESDASLERAADRFNEAVGEYNDLISRFPTSWFARLYRFGTKPALEHAAGPSGAAAAGPDRRAGSDPPAGNL